MRLIQGWSIALGGSAALPEDQHSADWWSACQYPAAARTAPSAAGEQFLTAVRPSAAAGSADGSRELIGFVCGTLSCASKLTEESMAVHEPEGGKNLARLCCQLY